MACNMLSSFNWAVKGHSGKVFSINRSVCAWLQSVAASVNQNWIVTSLVYVSAVRMIARGRGAWAYFILFEKGPYDKDGWISPAFESIIFIGWSVGWR